MLPSSGVRHAESVATVDDDHAPVVSDGSGTGYVVPVHPYYACRRCRVRLFDAAEVLPHDPPQGGGVGGSKKTFRFRRGCPSQRDGAPGDASPCTSLFLDPDQTPWVAEGIREANSSGAVVEPDTVYCRNPRCRAKLGTQSWTGSQCSCGAWITPAFRIHARAVDKVLAPETRRPTGHFSQGAQSDDASSYDCVRALAE
ncbi:hypothetical protein JKF63_06923 [Porcisia hertigi]|uniref:protein-tyrosine-phosphatase n=1 Tax=Porcisia hertigi TaxID=2761500 RepID=A0A836LJD3_9TRYP|nr:hypothetical protein JKF63_06923 [Porcisia hertigi]